MKLELVPMLHMQRDLYDMPRGTDRFRHYLDLMIGDSDDVTFLPMVAMNPMGKEHVAATYDVLLAIDAEAIAAEVLAEAEQRLGHAEGTFRVGLVVADDLAGGWTDRYAAEMSRFDAQPQLKRRWIVARFWTSEQPSVEKVRAEVMAAVFRIVYVQQHGWPTTLRQMLQQEGLAAAFAGITESPLDPEELAYTRDLIAPYLDSTDYPTQFAALWGDEAALMFGYRALGLSTWAGLALAVNDARHYATAPEAVLRGEDAAYQILHHLSAAP